MEESERRALTALAAVNWAPTPEGVWRLPSFHVPELHRDQLQLVLDSLDDAGADEGQNPVGVALLGSRGSGKSHLLSALRERVQRDGDFFVLVSLLEPQDFWRSAAQSVEEGLSVEVPGGESQMRLALRALGDLVGAPRSVRRAVRGEYPLTRMALDTFIELLRKTNRQVGVDCQDTARALVLRASENHDAQDVGHDFLTSNDEVNPGDRNAWGMRRGRRSPQELVRDVSRLLALVGRTVIAVDEIDVLLRDTARGTAGDNAYPEDWHQRLMAERIAEGLMNLRNFTRRTLTVVTCLPASWEVIKASVDTVQDRFREDVRLRNIPTEEVGRLLIERRFASRFAEIPYTPPHATWPVADSAFAEVVDFTPRELLRTVEGHIRSCLRNNEVRELPHLNGDIADPPETEPKDEPDDPVVEELDRRFEALVQTAEVGPAQDQDREDAVVPELLSAGLTAWIFAQAGATETYRLDPPASDKPPLHARLRRTLNADSPDHDDSEQEEHWGFRAVAARHGVAALNRIRSAITASGLIDGDPRRRLFLLRSSPWSPGARTRETLDRFTSAGGRTLEFPAEDIRILVALNELLKQEDTEKLRSWFRKRHPANRVSVFRAALADAATDAGSVETADPVPRRAAGAGRAADAYGSASPGGEVPLGVDDTTGAAVMVKLEALRKHVAVFAGSGSGKTVLIRRLVEECALRGVSAIVLDPNNDLARLGDEWPEPPDGWIAGDDDRADDFLRHTDVVVWTPRREAGRPLSFQPLPDFSGVLDDRDEFTAGVDAAVAAMAPRARVDANTNKAQVAQAVLRQALTHHARQGRSDLMSFVDLLSDLPDGVSDLTNAAKTAADMGQSLRAATVNDPLFAGAGTPVEPGVLLTPPPGKRARVSVISFIGLPSDEQRQGFVNQLQLALFSWIKRHPARDRALGGLLVMDEAQTLAPSGPMTPCTQSTLVLASQARKYGLGLVFATQAPKALHNRIPGNAATQFFGLLNSPVQIAAAREMARAKGSDVPDIGVLRRGQFYVAVDGAAFRRVQAPMCLSHHPRSPLTVEEVLDRARADR